MAPDSSGTPWRWDTIGAVAFVNMGQSPPGRFVRRGRRGGVPFLQGNAEFGERFPEPQLISTKPFKMAESGDTLISVRAPVGAINLADRPYCIGRGLAAIRFRVDGRFGYHALALHSAGLRRLSQGSTFEAVGGEHIRSLRFPNPGEMEQARIAEVLDTVDEAIRSTEQVIAKLEQVKRGLLHDLLTRGIDDNGEIRDPERHPEQFKDSRLGPMPRVWDCVPLREVLSSSDYGISTALSSDGEVPVLRMMNFVDGEASLSDLKFAPRSSVMGLLLRPGDVLFNRTNSIEHVGRTGIWRGQLERASFASYLVRLNPTRARVESEYLNLWLNHPRTAIHVKRFATPGVQQVNVNPTNLRRVLIAVPRSVDEQGAIASMFAESRAEIAAESRGLEKLRLLKKGLMDDLLTGRVRVPLPNGAA